MVPRTRMAFCEWRKRFVYKVWPHFSRVADSACSACNQSLQRGQRSIVQRKNIEKVLREFWGREPSKWNFRKFATNSNRYNSKPEIDFVTISTAFKKVWGTLNMPLKIFGQGALEGKGSNSQKKKVYNEQRNFFGTLTSFISRHNREHFLHLPTRYSRQNIVSTCAKFLKSDDRILRDGPPNRPRTKISNRYNSKPEIDFVTIPTAFTNVWGPQKCPWKFSARGRGRGQTRQSAKRSRISTREYIGGVAAENDSHAHLV